jgi:hypothetical protein
MFSIHAGSNAAGHKFSMRSAVADATGLASCRTSAVALPACGHRYEGRSFYALRFCTRWNGRWDGRHGSSAPRKCEQVIVELSATLVRVFVMTVMLGKGGRREARINK